MIQDNPPIGKSFGQCITQPKSVSAGKTVSATFIGANPRNNLRLDQTYGAVEKKKSDGTWEQVRSDADWFLTYSWKRKDPLFGTSEVTIEWETGEDGAVEKGEYRFRYYGDSKSIVGGKIKAFSGTSDSFTLG